MDLRDWYRTYQGAGEPLWRAYPLLSAVGLKDRAIGLGKLLAELVRSKQLSEPKREGEIVRFERAAIDRLLAKGEAPPLDAESLLAASSDAGLIADTTQLILPVGWWRERQGLQAADVG